jgi:hypothetical protein
MATMRHNVITFSRLEGYVCSALPYSSVRDAALKFQYNVLTSVADGCEFFSYTDAIEIFSLRVLYTSFDQIRDISRHLVLMQIAEVE